MSYLALIAAALIADLALAVWWIVRDFRRLDATPPTDEHFMPPASLTDLREDIAALTDEELMTQLRNLRTNIIRAHGQGLPTYREREAIRRHQYLNRTNGGV
jgi:hypothetical protein